MNDLAALDAPQTGFNGDLAGAKPANNKADQLAPWRFSPANARTMALKSAETRRAMRDARKNPRPQSPLIPQPPTTSAFPGTLLGRVRARITKLGAIMDTELDSPEADPKRLRELADALMKLSDLERTLDGRPLPGSRRPRETREPRGRTWMQNAPPAEADPGEPNG